jgi:5'-3' exonuclease
LPTELSSLVRESGTLNTSCPGILSQPTNSYFLLIDGYLNESGSINTKRLPVIQDEMDYWEREIFDKEYADMNWYKGKQAKHVKETEMGQNVETW